MGSNPIIVWFRRDLRIADNPALLYAARSGQPVVPLYVAGWDDPDVWAPGMAGRWWLKRSLERLGASLSLRGAPLRVARGRAEQVIPTIARALGAEEVVWNRLYEPYARELDLRLTVTFGQDGLKGRSFNAALLFEPEDRMSRSGRPFVQFAAYWRSCLASSEPDSPQPQVRELRCAAETAETTGEKGPEALRDFSEWEPQVRGMPRWEPGETGAHERLERFVEQILAGYEQSRDLPGIDGTSTISPHLHFGEIGPRQAWYAVRRAAQATTSARAARGPHTSGTMVGMEYLRQLGWREFAHYLLYHFPHIVTEPFRPEFARFPWEDDPDALDAWKRGATGYPLVDAGMRQLLAEGWMHNRVRMVVASFLTKDLLIPWQQGAAWFWDRLVDADLANNTLGWQWTAGSGPDAAPYFRIFNPVLQARRFDPDGTYLRLWLPEAPDGPGPSAHPRPLVDHGEARARALAAFRGISRPIGA